WQVPGRFDPGMTGRPSSRRCAAQATGNGGFFDRVVAVDAGKEDKGAGGAGIALGFALWVEGVAGDDDGGQVGGAAALAGDASRTGAREAEEAGQCFDCTLFDDC